MEIIYTFLISQSIFEGKIVLTLRKNGKILFENRLNASIGVFGLYKLSYKVGNIITDLFENIWNLKISSKITIEEYSLRFNNLTFLILHYINEIL